MNTPGNSLAGYAADEAMRQVDDAVELAVRRHEVFTEAHRRIDAVTVTQRSPEGAVEVTVGSSGNVLEVRCAETIRAMPPHQVAATIQACAQAAQAGVASRVEEILRAVAPGDPLTDELVANAHKTFPTPPTAPPGSAPGGSGPRELAIGGIEDDAPPPPRRAPRRRPARDHDADDWGGRSIRS
jgi:YbaB/EbfC DNA-binding family protein